jgi:REP element-mobilizing transposase RayT
MRQITLPEQRRKVARRARLDAWLDAGMGCCALRHPDVARYVQDSFLHFHGDRYHLHAWCVMPNHVHVLIQLLSDLASIVQGWKSFTARWILRNGAKLGVEVPDGRTLWMREYWDRYVRDENHYRTVVDYIHQNPVKAGLCASAELWRWTSASASGLFAGSAGVLAGTQARADEDVGAPRDLPY